MTIEFDVSLQQAENKERLDSIKNEYDIPDFSGTIVYDIMSKYHECNPKHRERQTQHICFFAAHCGGIIKVDDENIYFANGDTYPRRGKSLEERWKEEAEALAEYNGGIGEPNEPVTHIM